MNWVLMVYDHGGVDSLGTCARDPLYLVEIFLLLLLVFLLYSALFCCRCFVVFFHLHFFFFYMFILRLVRTLLLLFFYSCAHYYSRVIFISIYSIVAKTKKNKYVCAVYINMHVAYASVCVCDWRVFICLDDHVLWSQMAIGRLRWNEIYWISRYSTQAHVWVQMHFFFYHNA